MCHALCGDLLVCAVHAAVLPLQAVLRAPRASEAHAQDQTLQGMPSVVQATAELQGHSMDSSRIPVSVVLGFQCTVQ